MQMIMQIARWKSMRIELPRLGVPLLRAAEPNGHRWNVVPPRRPFPRLRLRIVQGRSSLTYMQISHVVASWNHEADVPLAQVHLSLLNETEKGLTELN